MTFEVIQTETTFRGRAFDVRQDQVSLPDGNRAKLDIVVHNESVSMIPLDADGLIWFIRQYRHPAQGELLELPAGVMESGERPEYSAGREIREEIGMSAEQLRKLGTFYLAPGYSTELMHVYLATGLKEDPLQPDRDEFIRIEKIAVQEAYRMAESGQIRDAKTLAALLLARPHLV
jgi:ADP-ribose pyrophosphatase